MKKNLYMLLFMAVALFSAVAMVSCGDDDEVIDLTDKYTLTFEVNTSNPEVKASEAYKAFVAEVQTIMKPATEQVFYYSDLQAKAEWLEIEMQYKGDTKIQNMLDARAKDLDDTTLSCSLKMLKNGNDWKSLDWKTWYKGY